jgi:hypothetical protein
MYGQGGSTNDSKGNEWVTWNEVGGEVLYIMTCNIDSLVCQSIYRCPCLYSSVDTGTCQG